MLRYKHKGQTYTRVWRGHSYYHVLKAAFAAANRIYTGKPRRLKMWGKWQDQMLRDHYHTNTKEEIAAMLTAKFKRKYTKNMVISRWHGIKHKESK